MSRHHRHRPSAPPGPEARLEPRRDLNIIEAPRGLRSASHHAQPHRRRDPRRIPTGVPGLPGPEHPLPILDPHPAGRAAWSPGSGAQHALPRPRAPPDQPQVHRPQPRRGVHRLGPVVWHVPTGGRGAGVWRRGGTPKLEPARERGDPALLRRLVPATGGGAFRDALVRQRGAGAVVGGRRCVHPRHPNLPDGAVGVVAARAVDGAVSPGPDRARPEHRRRLTVVGLAIVDDVVRIRRPAGTALRRDVRPAQGPGLPQRPNALPPTAPPPTSPSTIPTETPSPRPGSPGSRGSCRRGCSAPGTRWCRRSCRTPNRRYCRGCTPHRRAH